MARRFHGSIAPLPTPFAEEGARVDTAALRRLVEFQIANGSHGLSSTGTTGEPTSLSFEERKLVIRTVVEAASGRLPVLAGTGSNWTDESVELSMYAREVGADGILAVAPYHVKPSQQCLFALRENRESGRGPPGDALQHPGARLGQHRAGDPAANSRGFAQRLRDQGGEPRLPPGLVGLEVVGRNWGVFSGIETLCFPMLAVGGSGHVSATANVAPREVAELYDLVQGGRWKDAQDLHFRMLELNHVLFIETNPGPLKFLVGQMGLIEPAPRLPLVLPSEANQKKIVQVAREYGIL